MGQKGDRLAEKNPKRDMIASNMADRKPLLLLASVALLVLVVTPGISRLQIDPVDDGLGEFETSTFQDESPTTPLMVRVQIHDEQTNLSSRDVLVLITEIEAAFDPYPQASPNPDGSSDDQGTRDSIIYTLSLSTLVKELNSSGTRLWEAWQDHLDELGSGLSLPIRPSGNYSLPSDQTEINRLVGWIPPQLLQRVVADTNGDGLYDTGLIWFIPSKSTSKARLLENLTTLVEELSASTLPAEQPQISLELVGWESLRQENNEAQSLLFAQLIPPVAALVAIIIYYQTRRIAPDMACGLPAVLALTTALGFLGWSGISMPPSLALIAVLVLPIVAGMNLALYRFWVTPGGLRTYLTASGMLVLGGLLGIAADFEAAGAGLFVVTTVLLNALLTPMMMRALELLEIIQWPISDRSPKNKPPLQTPSVLRKAGALGIVSLLLAGAYSAIDLHQGGDPYDLVSEKLQAVEDFQRLKKNFGAGFPIYQYSSPNFEAYNFQTDRGQLDFLDAVELHQMGGTDPEDDTAFLGLASLASGGSLTIMDFLKAYRWLTFPEPDLLPLPGQTLVEEYSYWSLLHHPLVEANATVQKHLLEVALDSLWPASRALFYPQYPESWETLTWSEFPAYDFSQVGEKWYPFYLIAKISPNRIKVEGPYGPPLGVKVSVYQPLESFSIVTLLLWGAFILSLLFQINWRETNFVALFAILGSSDMRAAFPESNIRHKIAIALLPLTTALAFVSLWAALSQTYELDLASRRLIPLVIGFSGSLGILWACQLNLNNRSSRPVAMEAGLTGSVGFLLLLLVPMPEVREVAQFGLLVLAFVLLAACLSRSLSR